jgi:hypothetical protein
MAAKAVDLLMVLHQIDNLRGKVCGRCACYKRDCSVGQQRCRLNYLPAGPEDGCDEWIPRGAPVPDSPRDKCA